MKSHITTIAALLPCLTGMLLLAFDISADTGPEKTARATPKTETVPTVVACPPRGVTIDAVVTRIIDGDTIAVRSSVDYQIRLIDCWAPESRTRDQAEKTQGLQAKMRMQQIALGKEVRVHIPGSKDLTDLTTLGRVLGRVWVIRNAKPEPQDLSAQMVSENLATAQKRPTKQESSK